MKKILAMVLALCLLCGATAFATTLTPNANQGTTTLTTTINETYTLTIPATLNITYGATSTDLELTVSDYRLKAENQLKLSQSWDGRLDHTNGSNTIPYVLQYNGAEVSSSSNYVTFTGNKTETLKVVIAEAAWNSAAAGEYSDIVTFTANIVKK